MIIFYPMIIWMGWLELMKPRPSAQIFFYSQYKKSIKAAGKKIRGVE